MRLVASAKTQVANGSEDDLVALYLTHYGSLVRTAGLLLGDNGAGEEVAQEAYVRVFLARSAKPARDYRLAYLRVTVVNLARSRLRRRGLMHRSAGSIPNVVSAEATAIAGRHSVGAPASVAITPDRQREAIVLRFYSELSEAETAAAMRISPGAVKTHVHRAIATLAHQLKDHK